MVNEQEHSWHPNKFVFLRRAVGCGSLKSTIKKKKKKNQAAVLLSSYANFFNCPQVSCLWKICSHFFIFIVI